MEIFEVAKNLKTIEEFYEFCFGIHKSGKCSDKNCNFDLYIDLLKDVLDSNKFYHHRAVCFISQSMKHPNAFKIIFNIQKIGKKMLKNFTDHLNYKL